MKRFLWLLYFLALPAFGAGKDTLNTFPLIKAGDMTGDLASSSFSTQFWDNVDFMFVVTGTPTGNFYVDCTLDNPTTSPTVRWVQIPLSPGPSASGAATNIVIEINQSGCSFMRMRYVHASSTGTLNAYARAKGV